MGNRIAVELLPKGSRVGVAAPAFAVPPGSLDPGVAALRRMGFDVAVGRHAKSRHGYLAGDDEARLADLDGMLRDPSIDAVWFARGGYGCTRLLDRIGWRALARRPKPLIGYSDITALFGPAIDRCACPCLHGPFVVELDSPEAWHRPSLRASLDGRPWDLPIRARQVLVPGRARGRLVGGNLSVLVSLAGTRFMPRLSGRVVFLEDVGEQTYRIDRALVQLRQAGALRDLAGVLIGGMDPAPRTRFPPDRRLVDVLRETFEPLGVPVVHKLPAGHGKRKRTLPLGGSASIDTGRGRVRFSPKVERD